MTWRQITYQYKSKKIIGGQALIDQAFKDKQHKIGLPKSGKPRTVPLARGLAEALAVAQKDAKGQWVFGFSENRPLGYKQWAEAVKKAAIKAKCPEATIHVLRHSLNTHLKSTNAGDAQIRAALGWSGEAIQGNYTHAEEYDYSSMAEAIDNLKLTGGTK